MPGLDLMKFVNSSINHKITVEALEGLGQASDGPLRATYSHGTIKIGVRTWTQFFKEHLLHDHSYIKDKEKETQDAVETFVTLLEEKLAKNLSDQKDKFNAARMAQAIYKLRAKASGRDLSPQLGKTAHLRGATTEPKYNKVHNSRIKTFLGKIFIPQGLSMGTVPICQVIADRCFGHSLVRIHSTNYGKAEPINIPHGPTEYSEKEYFGFYKNLFSSVEDKENSVAIELFNDPNFKVSEANRNGAWLAASEFVAERKKLGKDVSVILCLDKMPRLGAEPPTASKTLSADAAKAVDSSPTGRGKRQDSSTPTLLENKEGDAEESSTSYSDSE